MGQPAVTVIPDAILDEVARRFSLLGDPTRLRVVRALHDVGESSVQEVADLAGTTLPNASQHLLRLHEAGFVARRRDGKNVRYSITDPTIEDLCRTVCDSVRERARVQSA
jgi:DNA-binding transcriptional ArsR family regulator